MIFQQFKKNIQMKAVILTKYGLSEVIQIAEIGKPIPNK